MLAGESGHGVSFFVEVSQRSWLVEIDQPLRLVHRLGEDGH